MINGTDSEAAAEWRTWAMAFLLIAGGLLAGWNTARTPQSSAAEHPATSFGPSFHGSAPAQNVLARSLAAKLAPPWAREPARGFSINSEMDPSARPTPFSYRDGDAHSMAAADTRVK